MAAESGTLKSSAAAIASVFKPYGFRLQKSDSYYGSFESRLSKVTIQVA